MGKGIEPNKGNDREMTEEWELEMRMGPLPQLHINPVSNRKVLAESGLFNKTLMVNGRDLKFMQLTDGQVFPVNMNGSTNLVELVNGGNRAQNLGPGIRFIIIDEKSRNIAGFIQFSTLS